MKLKNKLSVGVALIVAAIGTQAQASVIDFEDIAVVPGTSLIEATEISGGFVFTSPSNHIHRTNAGNGSFADDGTTYLFTHDNGGQNANNALTMALVTGGTFSISSLDLSEGFVGFGANTVHVLGNLFGGGTITQDFVLDGIIDGIGPGNDFESFSFGIGWHNLIDLTFTGVGGTANEHAFAVDNIDVSGSPVPEPSTLLLLGFGLASLGIARRRRGGVAR